jgi:hypothetical protein
MRRGEVEVNTDWSKMASEGGLIFFRQPVLDLGVNHQWAAPETWGGRRAEAKLSTH